MKGLYTLCAAVLCALSLHAQTFSDGFETYNVGEYIGVGSSVWTTWSGNTGGAEDVQVTDADANNGSKSVYFSSTSPNGGPQDVVLPFGGAYNSGNFTFEASFLVEAGKDAYFNFQANETIGQVWALDVYMRADGTLLISSGGTTMLETACPNNAWFDLKFEIDLDVNSWEVFVNETSVGEFENPTNQIASLDVYPVASSAGNTLSGFYMDDVAFEYNATTLPDRNGAVTAIDGITGLASQMKVPRVSVRNLGNNPITSFDLAVEYQGNTITKSFSGFNLLSLETASVAMDDELELEAGTNDFTATISNVNGMGADEDPSDDSKSVAANPIVPAMHKKVVAEEATGTWCGWCPRGTVAMAEMQENYPEFFVGLAVHNNDPMEDDMYDSGIGTLISGYPSAVVDRGSDIDPTAIENEFLQRVQIGPKAILCNTAQYDSSLNVLTVQLRVKLLGDITSAYKVAIALAEDGVTGTASGYAQANYYHGGGSGELSGAGHEWHSAGNPVPASQMVYDHVARAIAPSFAGAADAFPNGGVVGDVFSYEAQFQIDPSWNTEKVHIAGMLIDEQGRIDNASQFTIAEALSNICEITFPTVISEVTTFEEEKLVLFPNPAGEFVNVQLNIGQKEDAQLVVRDMTGRVVMSRSVNQIVDNSLLQINTSDLSTGLYHVQVFVEGLQYTAPLLKN